MSPRAAAAALLSFAAGLACCSPASAQLLPPPQLSRAGFQSAVFAHKSSSPQCGGHLSPCFSGSGSFLADARGNLVIASTVRGCSLLLGSATFLPGGGHGFVSEEGNATGVARLNVSFQLATAAGSFMSLANGSCVVSYTLRGGASPSVGVLAPGPGASAPGVPGGGAACAAAVKATPCIAGGFKALWAAAPGDGAAAPGRSVWAALSTSGNATCGGLFGAAVVTSFPGEPQSAAFDPRKALDGLTGGTVPLVWPPSFNLTTTSAGAAALSLPGSLFSLSLDKCVFAYKYTWSPATPAPV